MIPAVILKEHLWFVFLCTLFYQFEMVFISRVFFCAPFKRHFVLSFLVLFFCFRYIMCIAFLLWLLCGAASACINDKWEIIQSLLKSGSWQSVCTTSNLANWSSLLLGLSPNGYPGKPEGDKLWQPRSVITGGLVSRGKEFISTTDLKAEEADVDGSD